MPTPGDIRAQFAVQVRAEGVGEVSRLEQELARLRAEIAGHKEQFLQAATSGKEYLGAITPLNTQVNKFQRELNAARVAQEEQAQALTRAISHSNDWSRAIEQGSKVARDHNQQLADMARLQAALGGMEERDHEADAAEAAAQAERELMEVRQALARMDERDAVASREAAEVRQRTAREGTQAVLGEAEATKRALQEEQAALLESERAQKQRADAIERATAEVVAASGRVNAALSRDAAEESRLRSKEDAELTEAAARHARFLDQEAEREIAAAERVEAIHDRIRKTDHRENAGDAGIRDRAGINREQERLNFLIAEGADLEYKATKVIDASASSYRTKSFEVQKSADGLTQFIDVTAKTTSRQNQEFEKGAEASKRFSYGILNIAHAAQDLQYGFGAVLNNIPLVVQSLGGSAGMAGAIMVAGVGVSVFGDHIKQLAQEIGALPDPTTKAAGTLGELKQKLADIEAKPHKLELDYQAIVSAGMQIEELERRLGAFRSAAGEFTELQGKVATGVRKAIAEEAGGTDDKSGAQNLLNLIKLSKEKEGPDAFIKEHPEYKNIVTLREDLGRLEGMKPEDLTEAAALAERIRTVKEEIARKTSEVTASVERGTMANIGDATMGRAGGIDYLQQFLRMDPGTFAAGGQITDRGGKRVQVQPVSPIFGQALQESRPEVLKALQQEEEAERLDEQKRRDKAFRKGIQKQVDAKDQARFDAWSKAQTEESQRSHEEFNKARALAVQQAIDSSNDILNKAKGEQRALTKAERARITELRKQAKDNREEEKLGAEVTKHGVAQQLLGEFGGGISQEQALKAADVYQANMKQAKDPAVALRQALVTANQFLAENAATMAQMFGATQELNMMFMTAQQNLQQLGAMAAATRGQVQHQRGRQRVQRPWPWGTIGGG